MYIAFLLAVIKKSSFGQSKCAKVWHYFLIQVCIAIRLIVGIFVGFFVIISIFSFNFCYFLAENTPKIKTAGNQAPKKKATANAWSTCQGKQMKRAVVHFGQVQNFHLWLRLQKG